MRTSYVKKVQCGSQQPLPEIPGKPLHLSIFLKCQERDFNPHSADQKNQTYLHKLNIVKFQVFCNNLACLKKQLCGGSLISFNLQECMEVYWTSR